MWYFRTMTSVHHREVIKYYEQTDWDHRYVWNRGIYQAAHFGIYDDNASTHASALLNTNEIMGKMTGLKQGDKVLDAGCGWGGTSLWLAKEKGAQVHGVNITKYQVKECKQKAKKLGLQNEVFFVESDYCDTPFGDHQFDIVWSCESLCHAPDKRTFYQEAFRVLKPGGHLVIADYHRCDRPFDTADEKLLQTWLSGWACKDIDTSNEHCRYASSVGFRHIDHQDYSDQVRASLRNLYTHAARWSWIGYLGDKLKLLKPYRLKNVLGTKAMYHSFEAGLWRYMLVHCIKPGS